MTREDIIEIVSNYPILYYTNESSILSVRIKNPHLNDILVSVWKNGEFSYYQEIGQYPDNSIFTCDIVRYKLANFTREQFIELMERFNKNYINN